MKPENYKNEVQLHEIHPAQVVTSTCEHLGLDLREVKSIDCPYRFGFTSTRQEVITICHFVNHIL